MNKPNSIAACLVLGFSLIINFQNCAGGFQSERGGMTSASASEGAVTSLIADSESQLSDLNNRGVKGDPNLPADARDSQSSSQSSQAPLIAPAPQQGSASNDSIIYVSTSGADTNAGTIASPFKTVARAQQQVRAIRARVQSDIVVYLRGGTYYLPTTLRFGSEDGGAGLRTVTYTSYPGETASLSGGSAVNAVSNGSIDFSFAGARPTNLYLDGSMNQLPTLARIPTRAQGHFFVSSFNRSGSGSTCSVQSMDLTYSGGVPISSAFSVEELAALAGSEAVLVRPFAKTMAIVAGTAVNGSTLTVYFDPTEAIKLCSSYEDHFVPGQRVFFQGQKAFIKTEGDWAYDEGTVYYHGVSGSTLVVPRLDSLLEIAGTENAPVKNLVFSGLELRDTGQGDNLSRFTLGAVSLRFAENIKIDHCHLARLGGIGIRILGGSSRISIANNVIEDTGATGIYIYTTDISDGNDPKQIASAVEIENNLIQNIGFDSIGHGIFAYYLPNGRIRNNTVRYTGSIGIGRGNLSDVNHVELPGENSVIEANDVGFSMQVFDDGGGIYVAGKGTAGTLIKNNYIHDIFSLKPSGFFSVLRVGLYIDGLAESVTAQDNVVCNSTNGIYVQTQISPDWRVRDSLIASYVCEVSTPLVYADFADESALRATLGAVGTDIHYAWLPSPQFRGVLGGVAPSTQATWPREFARANRF